MSFTLVYFHPKVLSAIERWPVDVLADYARLAVLLGEHGPHLRLPWSRAMGGGLFELRASGNGVAGRVFYGFLADRRIVVLHAILKKSRTTPPAALALARNRLELSRHG